MDVLIVSFADKLNKIRAIREDYEKLGEFIWLCFNHPKEKQQEYYQNLAKVFAERISVDPEIPLLKEFIAEVQWVFDKNAAIPNFLIDEEGIF